MLRLIFMLLAIYAFDASTSSRAAGISSPKTRWRYQTSGPIRGGSVINGDRLGNGFASSRTWAWKVPVTSHDLDLELIYKLAIYGLE